MSRPSLTQIRAVSGVTAKRWKDLLPQLASLKSKAEESKAEESKAEESKAEVQTDGYDLNIEWTEARHGSGSYGISLWAEGKNLSPGMKSNRCYLAPKRKYEGRNQIGIEYHLVFLPNNPKADVEVSVNGEILGETQSSNAPGSEWQLEKALVKQLRVELPQDSEWVADLARQFDIDLS